jgi:glycosyltransferase involved in cell wall biosynthesis
MILMTEFINDARVTKEAKTLCDAGHKIIVIALKSHDTLEFEKRFNFEISRINISTRYLLPKGQIFFFFKYLEFVFQVVIKLLKMKIDLYHAHDLETLPIAYIISKIKRRPIIYDSHELYIDVDKHHPIARKVWYIVEKLLVKKIKTIIFTTVSRGRVFSHRYGVSLPKIIMNCQYLNFQSKTNVLREQLHISNNNKILIYQGKIAPSRGIDILIETMKYLENIVLVVIGPGNYKESLQKKIDTHKKRDKIYILDPVPWATLASVTASADLGVFLLQNVSLQYYYALSNKIFEYLSAGLPVVFSDFPEMRKLIVENEVGFVVDETNPKTVAEAINTILSNKSLYNKMSKNAKRIVTEKYNWEIEGQKLLDIYNNLDNSI